MVIFQVNQDRINFYWKKIKICTYVFLIYSFDLKIRRFNSFSFHGRKKSSENDIIENIRFSFFVAFSTTRVSSSSFLPSLIIPD